MNGKIASMHDHILIEQIHEAAVVSSFDIAEAKTMLVDMQPMKGFGTQTLPTIDKLLRN